MPAITEYYQAVGFSFEVYFKGIGTGQGRKSIDSRFQSVSGLEVTMETESIKEGGENRFEHVIPTRRKYSDLILKRGTLDPSEATKLSKWCRSAFDDYKFHPIDIDIYLLDQEHNALWTWRVIHAWPKAWKFGELNAEKSEVFIETLELNYNYFLFKGKAE